MLARVKLSALRQSQPHEYVLRFALGGIVTVIAGLIADTWGPAIGGFMLAFPAIFCASATLVEKHERERKAKQRLRGEIRGRQAAALDAAGAAWGAIAMAAFGCVIWMRSELGALARLLHWRSPRQLGAASRL